ncbi:MAG: hypothetical protein QNJ42_14400 [Crocosphaera sp.]|nr:hypothetical protein [Crocosphaera sp.]
MSQFRVFADFHNADSQGRLRLNCTGTLEDLSFQKIYLKKGQELTLYSEDLEVDGVVDYSSEENLWVAIINWDRIREIEDFEIEKNFVTPFRRKLDPIEKGVIEATLYKNKYIAALSMVFVVIIYISLGGFSNLIEINNYFVLGTLIWIFFLLVDMILIKFRIDKDFYGENEFEVREFYGDSPKKSFNQEDLKQIKEEIINEFNVLVKANI